MGEFDDFKSYLEGLGLSRSVPDYINELKNLYKIAIKFRGSMERAKAEYISKAINPKRRAFIEHYIRFKGDVNFKLPKYRGYKPKREKIIATEEEEEKLRELLYKQSERNGIIFDLLSVCALRRSETLGINYNDFYWNEWVSDNRWKTEPLRLHLRYETTKFQKERIIPVPNKLARKIHKFVKGLDKKKRISDKDRKIFKIKPITWNSILYKACKKVLDRNVNPHLLRFTRANRLDKAGADIQDIQNTLGHKDLSTTQKYIQRDKETSFNNVAKILQLDGY